MRIRIAPTLGIFALILSASTGFAATGSTTQTNGHSKLSEKGLLRTVADNIRLSWYGELAGPSLGRPSAMTTDSRGEYAAPMDVYNSVKLGYMVTPKMKAFVNPRFATKVVYGGGFDFLNARIGVNPPLSIKRGKFSASIIDATLELPTTGSSLDSGLIVAPGSNQIASRTQGRWTLGVVTSERAYIYSKADGARDLALAAIPFAEFQVSPKVKATLEYEMLAYHYNGDSLGKFAKLSTRLMPGVSWDVLPQLNVKPFLNLYPGDKLDLDSTSVNLAVSGTIF